MFKHWQTILQSSNLNPWLILCAAVVFAILTMIIFKYHRYSLKIGWFLNLTIYCAMTAYLLMAASMSLPFFTLVLTMTVIFVGILIGLALYSALTLVAWSFRLSANTKYRSCYHFATDLVVFIFLVICLLLLMALFRIQLPAPIGALLSFGPFFTTYLAFVFANFLTQTILINWQGRLAKLQSTDYDYLIILGAGLLNGNRISASLAQRIHAALVFADKHGQPIIIASGGKGSDEQLSEAAAIGQELIKAGYPSNKIRREAQSTNTWENFHNSMKLIRQETQAERQLHLAFVSSSYHLTRAAYLAEKEKINITAIPAATPKNYIASGWFREFAAMLLIKKHQQVVVLSLFLFASLFWAAFIWLS